MFSFLLYCGIPRSSALPYSPLLCAPLTPNLPSHTSLSSPHCVTQPHCTASAALRSTLHRVLLIALPHASWLHPASPNLNVFPSIYAHLNNMAMWRHFWNTFALQSLTNPYLLTLWRMYLCVQLPSVRAVLGVESRSDAATLSVTEVSIVQSNFNLLLGSSTLQTDVAKLKAKLLYFWLYDAER